MNPNSRRPQVPIADDPRLTAYALGELDPSEIQAFETELRGIPAGGDLAQETASFANLVGAAYEMDPEHGLTDAQREQVLQFPAVAPGGRDNVVAMNTIQLRHAAKPRRWGALALSAAAVLAGGIGIAFLVQELSSNPRPEDASPTGSPSPFPVVTVDNQPARAIQSDKPIIGFTSKYRPGGVRTSIRNIIPEDATENLLSSFPLNVDDATYDLQRREIDSGKLPSPDGIRIEELVNHFHFATQAGSQAETIPPGPDPIMVDLEVAVCPWNEDHRLARVTLKGPKNTSDSRPVRLQVEFNPVNVKRYTLLGYGGKSSTSSSEGTGEEHAASLLGKGETIAPGKTVTALYEIVPTTPQEVVLMKARARQTMSPSLIAASPTELDLPFFSASDELLSVNISHGDVLAEHSLPNNDKAWKTSSNDFRFAAAVAGYGMLLSRDQGKREKSSSQHPGQQRMDLDYNLVLKLARSGIGEDPDGRRKEFIDLVRKTARIDRLSRR